MTIFSFRSMDEVSARDIAAWRYPPPYDLYNCDPADVETQVKTFLNPTNHYFTVWNDQTDRIAFRCFGPDAQVPGGDYRAPALDMGGGLRPDLTGQGLGAPVLQAAFTFARHTFDPPAFRATVAAFNQRALRVCKRVGYRPVQRFQHAGSGREFVVLWRRVLDD